MIAEINAARATAGLAGLMAHENRTESTAFLAGEMAGRKANLTHDEVPAGQYPGGNLHTTD